MHQYFCGLFVAFALITSSAAGQPERKAGDIVLEKVTLTIPESHKVSVEFGTLYVPENRADPKSRLIGVGFARFKAIKESDAPPTFHLPGGPGNSLITGLRQGGRFLGLRLRSLDYYRTVGDVILVDQRGFSESGDVLLYKHRTKEQPLDQPGTLSQSTLAFTAMAKAAVAHYAANNVDLRGYTVKECAADVNDLRRALGYDKITLVGTSFGSQWSFAIMRLYPDMVARALLSGMEPLDHGYDMPSHVLAAVQRMWWQAEQDKRLKPYLPPGGLMQAAREVRDRLTRAPVEVETKSKVKVVLGREDFQRDAFFRGPAGPAFVLSLYHGRYDAWANEVLARRRSHDMQLRVIGPVIDTSLGVTPKRKFLLRNDPASELLGQWNFDAYLATTGIWPSPDVGDEFRTPVVSRIPVVFAQGDWDTSTPVENTYEIAPYFPNGRVLIAEHGGHGVLGPIAQSLPKVMTTLLTFLKTGNHAEVPVRVTLPMPAFTVPDFPAP